MADRLAARPLILRTVCAASWPAAAALAGLALTGHLAAPAAALAAGVAAALLWAPAARHHREMARLVGALESLGVDGAAERPPGRLRIASPMLGARIGAALSDAAAGLGARYRRLLDRHASSERLIAHLPGPVIAIDGNRRVVRAAGGGGAPFDRAPAGGDLAAVLRDPGVLEAADRVLRGGGAEEIDFAGGPSAETAFAARIVGLAEPAPDGTKAVVEVSDVTAARRVERTRADFIANASHELRTPLSVLLGCIQTLRGPARGDDAAQERFLAMMEDQTERMARLVGDLLSLSRIELAEHRPHTETAALMPVVAHVTDTLQFAARSRGIEIETDCALAEPVVVGDRDELTQLFQNLIDNAVKYGREGSRVAVRIGPDRLDDGGPAVSVAVADRGEGIAEEHLPRLTERFYRVDTARSRELGGTGLGLAIVKHIVGRHRGRLGIESTPGEGSVFSVVLPAPDSVMKP